MNGYDVSENTRLVDTLWLGIATERPAEPVMRSRRKLIRARARQVTNEAEAVPSLGDAGNRSEVSPSPSFSKSAMYFRDLAPAGVCAVEDGDVREAVAVKVPSGDLEASEAGAGRGMESRSLQHQRQSAPCHRHGGSECQCRHPHLAAPARAQGLRSPSWSKSAARSREPKTVGQCKQGRLPAKLPLPSFSRV